MKGQWHPPGVKPEEFDEMVEGRRDVILEAEADGSGCERNIRVFAQQDVEHGMRHGAIEEVRAIQTYVARRGIEGMSTRLEHRLHDLRGGS